ncbi:MAG: PHP domain-containing protein [Chloroflexi bacterium]|nr:PHP domain-containing protein [Chloroflexota bacterium]
MNVIKVSSLITELHCHTRASDGLNSPSALVELASLRDVKVLAITDHDTIAGHAEAIGAGRQYNVRVIPGIEVSSLSDQGEVHVLGYGVQPEDESTRQRILDLRDARDGRAKAIVSKLHALGVPVSYQRVKEIAGDSMVGRPHVARALLEGRWVVTRQQAFDDYLAEGKPAFVPHTGLTPSQAVELIHRARGVAVLAHPGLYAGNLSRLIEDMLAHGLDGIEVFYPLHSVEQTSQYLALAQRRGLLITGGSDFHGLVGDNEASLGSIHLPEGSIEALDARIAQQSIAG